MKPDRLLLLVEDYLDGTLSPRDRETFERALRVRPDLRAEVEACRRLSRLAAREPGPAVPGDLGEAVRRRLPRRSPRAARVVPLLAAAAAAAVLVLVFPLSPPSPLSSAPRTAGPGHARGAVSPHALADWLAQAENAGPRDAGWLAAEAREIGLLARVRAALREASGPRRRFLAAAEDLLVQVENDPGFLSLADEARVVSLARLP